MTETSNPSALFAARIAPHVDRLFIAGHQAARPYPRTAMQELHVQSLGLLPDLRKLLLNPAGASREQILVFERYLDRDTLAGILDLHVSEGLLERDADRFLPTDRGTVLLHHLTDALIEGTLSLWEAHEPACRKAVELMSEVLERAAEQVTSFDYPAFHAERSGYMPSDAPLAFRLWSNIATLRYLRTDAHALAWHAAGLDAREILCLTALRDASQGGASTLPKQAIPQNQCTAEAMQRLHKPGWVAGTGSDSTITVEGVEARARIETETNSRACVPYRELPAGRLAILLETLGKLPPL